MTHREYLLRLAWIEEEWKTPQRHDYYLMQIAQEVRRVLSKKPNSIKLEHFKLGFGEQEAKPRQDVATQKSLWLSILEKVKK